MEQPAIIVKEKDYTNHWGDNMVQYMWDGPEDPDEEI